MNALELLNGRSGTKNTTGGICSSLNSSLKVALLQKGIQLTRIEILAARKLTTTCELDGRLGVATLHKKGDDVGFVNSESQNLTFAVDAMNASDRIAASDEHRAFSEAIAVNKGTGFSLKNLNKTELGDNNDDTVLVADAH